jgi:hypothetical protein
MSEIFFTLVSDGSSDSVLLHHLQWLLRQHIGDRVTLTPQWADLRSLRRRPRTLRERIERSLELYPCNLLFVHRDAEREEPTVREEEVRDAVAELRLQVPVLPIVPVRMTEAWLLFDVSAIRQAAGNPNGRVRLRVPVRDAEEVADPKAVLHETLRTASELSGRKLRKFRTSRAVHRVAELVQDFSPLRALPSFSRLENALAELVSRKGWGRMPVP